MSTTFSHCKITQSTTTYGVWSYRHLTFNKCSLNRPSAAGAFIVDQNMTNYDLTVNYCQSVLPGGDGFLRIITAIRDVVINGGLFNAGINPNSKPISSLDLKYCNFIYSTSFNVFYTVFNCNVIGEIKARSINYSNITGSVVILPTANATITNNSIYTTTAVSSLSISIANNSDITGIVVSDNTISGSRTSQYIVYIGATTESGFNAINGLVFVRNKIINRDSNVGSAHTLFIGGGINPTIKYNDITSTNGYAMVIKAGGYHYTTTDAHVSYNIIRHSIALTKSIYGRGVYGIIVANNTIMGVNTPTQSVFDIDDDLAALDNSGLFINNIIVLGANTLKYYDGANLTTRNNTINKNGFTLSQAIYVDDFEIATAIDSDGVPASKIEHAEVVPDDELENDIGLASDYVIPNSVTYENQGILWQNGAVILP